jgi:hypothetical protein
LHLSQTSMLVSPHGILHDHSPCITLNDTHTFLTIYTI